MHKNIKHMLAYCIRAAVRITRSYAANRRTKRDVCARELFYFPYIFAGCFPKMFGRVDGLKSVVCRLAPMRLWLRVTELNTFTFDYNNCFIFRYLFFLCNHFQFQSWICANRFGGVCNYFLFCFLAICNLLYSSWLVWGVKGRCRRLQQGTSRWVSW